MKRFFVCFLIVISLVPLSTAISVPLDTPVYVTPHGEKYHREGCSYVSTARELTISAAICQGYEPCSRCDPDTFTSAYIPPADESNHSDVRPEKAPTDDSIHIEFPTQSTPSVAPPQEVKESIFVGFIRGVLVFFGYILLFVLFLIELFFGALFFLLVPVIAFLEWLGKKNSPR